MDFKLFKKIINESAKFGIPIFRPTGFGEPLLYPKILDAIKYAKSKKIRFVLLTTNGILLNKQKALKLMSTGVDKVTFSDESINEKQYSALRGKREFKTLLENIRYLKNLRDKSKQKKPVIAVRTIIGLKQGCKDYNKFKEFWEKRVDYVEGFYPYRFEFNKSEILFKKFRLFNMSHCNKPFTSLVILANGKVSFCCRDYNGLLIVGDSRKQSLKEIWNSKKIKHARKILNVDHINEMKKEYPFCYKCFQNNFKSK